MKHISFAIIGFELRAKRTRKRVFLKEMNRVVPWVELVGLIQPFAANGTGAKVGRPSFAVENKLRIHFLQHWFGLKAPAMEEALRDVSQYCEFARLDPGCTRLPDETPILRFRDMPEGNNPSIQFLATINATLATKGLMLKSGAVVDATLIAAPSSTTNSSNERDPEMHQTKMGSQWHFCMKAHIGLDTESGLVHTIVGTAANFNDVTQGHGLLHGEEEVVFADAGYQRAKKRPEAKGVQWHVAMRRGKRRALDKHSPWSNLMDKAEQLKASVWARVEHPFRALKCQFGFAKVRYRGRSMNTVQLVTLFALSNLWTAHKRILQGVMA